EFARGLADREATDPPTAGAGGGADAEAALSALGAASFHPKALKVALAKRLVADFHSREAADEAEREFSLVFAKGETPTEVEEISRSAADGPLWLPKLLTEAGLVKSNGEAVRLIAQGGVSLDGVRVDSKDQRLDAAAGRSYLLKVGKR